MNCHHGRIELIIEHGAARAHERICRRILARVLVGDRHDVGDAALAILRCLRGLSILPLRIQRLKLLTIEPRQALFLQPPEDQFIVRRTIGIGGAQQISRSIHSVEQGQAIKCHGSPCAPRPCA